MKFLKSMSLENKLRSIGVIKLIVVSMVHAHITLPMPVIVPLFALAVGLFIFAHVKDTIKKKAT